MSGAATVGTVVPFTTRRVLQRQASRDKGAQRLARTLAARLCAEGYTTLTQQIAVFREGTGVDIRTARKILSGVYSRKATVNVLTALAEHLGVFAGWLVDATCPYRTLEAVEALRPVLRVAAENPFLFERMNRLMDQGKLDVLGAIGMAERWLASAQEVNHAE